MLSLALPRKSWAHGIPASAKLAGLLVVSVTLFPVKDPVVLTGALAAVLLLTGSLGAAAIRQTARFVVPLAFMIGLLLLFHIVFGQLRDGLAIVLRLLTLVLLANFVTMTTALSEMMGLVERLLAPLAWLGVNVWAISLAMGLAIRFTPVLLTKSGVLFDAWRARSQKPARWRLVVPIGLAALDDAEQISDALRARGGVPSTIRSE